MITKNTSEIKNIVFIGGSSGCKYLQKKKK
jgi:hypothetical protein